MSDNDPIPYNTFLPDCGKTVLEMHYICQHLNDEIHARKTEGGFCYLMSMEHARDRRNLQSAEQELIDVALYPYSLT